MNSQENVFSGIKVVELATYVAAPCAGRYFADLGASVVKIEGFGGDPLRTTAPSEGRPSDPYEDTTWDLENAGKKGIALNLKDQAGKDVLFRMLDEADVFITNWRSDALLRAALDYETLKVRYPKLIYAQLTGYGELGSDKDLPGFDFTAFFARGGWLGTLYEKGSDPMNLVAGLGDHQAGLYLSAGIMSSLYKAEKTGQGEKVTVSLYHCAIYALGLLVQSAQYGNRYPINKRDMLNPFMNAFKTSDERLIQLAMPPYNVFFPKFMEIIGQPELKDDPKYCDFETLGDNSKHIYDLVNDYMKTKTVAEHKEIFVKEDIPFAIAQLWEEILEDEQAWANDFLCSLKYDNGNTRTLLRQPVKFKEMGLPEYTRGPYIGEHSQEVLLELGYSNDEISELKEKRIFVEWDDIKKK